MIDLGKPVPRERFHPFPGLSMTDLIDMEQGMSEFQVRGVDEIKAPMNFHGLDSRVDSKIGTRLSWIARGKWLNG